MKVVARDIECIVWFNKNGITPIKFRYEDDNGQYKTVKVNKITSRAEEQLCGSKALVFECQSLIDNVMKLYQLKYFVSECKWILWKI